MTAHPYRTSVPTEPVEHVERRRPGRLGSSAQTMALRFFVRAIRNAKLYDALATKSWHGEDDKPKPHVLVRALLVGTVGLSATTTAATWWQAAWQFAEIRWLSRES